MRRIDRAVEIALRLRQARAEAGKLMDEIEKLTGGGGAPSVEKNGTSPPAVQVGRRGPYRGKTYELGAGAARVAELRDQIARGVYVPFAALHAEFAGVAKVVSEPCARELERNERKRRYMRERARAAPAEASP